MSLENTSYQEPSGHPGSSEDLRDHSALWPAAEQTGPAQPFPHQPGSYPAGGGSRQMVVPVPLYSVPERHLPGTGGGLPVSGAPGGRAWKETPQTCPPHGKMSLPGWSLGEHLGGEEAGEGGAETSAMPGLPCIQRRVCTSSCPPPVGLSTARPPADTPALPLENLVATREAVGWGREKSATGTSSCSVDPPLSEVLLHPRGLQGLCFCPGPGFSRPIKPWTAGAECG